MQLRSVVCLFAALASVGSYAQQHPRDREIHDADTLAWWHTTEDLSNDSMQGRDTGTAAYQRAAEYVERRFKAAGLKPAGENGSYFQTVPMHEIDLVPEGTSFTVVRENGTRVPLRFLYEITTTPANGVALEGAGALTFRGTAARTRCTMLRARWWCALGRSGKGCRVERSVWPMRGRAERLRLLTSMIRTSRLSRHVGLMRMRGA